jgi:hypothetical protein
MDEQPTLTIPAQRGFHPIPPKIAKFFGFGALMQRRQGGGPYADRDVIILADNRWNTPVPVVSESTGVKIFRRDGVIEVHAPIGHNAVLQLA